MNKLCECGCGQEVNNSKVRFIRGHSNRNQEIKEKKVQRCLEHYGVKNPSQVEEIKKKKEQSAINRFGGIGYSSNILAKKTKNTIQKKYGLDHFSKTIQGRLICRENAIRLVENRKLNGEPLMPNIGFQERSFFDEIQKYTTCNIIRNDLSFRYVIGRYPDGHIPELKLFIQFDERVHFKDKGCKIYKENDNKCLLELASLGYIVFRVSEKQWKENKEKVIKDFKVLIDYIL